MLQTPFIAKTAVVLAALALVALGPAGAQDKEFKGQLKVGIHKTELQVGKIYSVVLDCKCSDVSFPIVDSSPSHLKVFYGDSPHHDTMFIIPVKTGEHTFRVYLPLTPNEPVVDYTLSIKLADDKLILKDKVTITTTDPIYPPRMARHKVVPIQLKANTFYIIDLVKTGNQDPYLYLEDAAKQMVASDDDSGGDKNARIIYRPAKDGEYRIIATTYDKSIGDMNLTVRMLPGKNK
jgi:hypothetical protein